MKIKQYENVYLVTDMPSDRKWWEFWKPSRKITKAKMFRKDAERFIRANLKHPSLYVRYSIEEL